MTKPTTTTTNSIRGGGGTGVNRGAGDAPFAVGPSAQETKTRTEPFGTVVNTPFATDRDPPNNSNAMRSRRSPAPFGTDEDNPKVPTGVKPRHLRNETIIAPVGICELSTEKHKDELFFRAKNVSSDVPFATDTGGAPLERWVHSDEIHQRRPPAHGTKRQPAPFATDKDTVEKAKGETFGVRSPTAHNQRKEAPFATSLSTAAAPVKPRIQRREAPFATGPQMEGSYVHKPATAAARSVRPSMGYSSVGELFAN
eukprot:Selendium_serpulae@DN3403_c0_g1_i2.p1